MADLDSLNIRLTASAGDATKAIDSIIGALTKLNGALNNFGAESKYMKGLNNLSSGLKSVRISLNGLDSGKIQEVAKALDKLSSASAKLASLTGIAPKVDTQAMDKVVAASDKAIAKAKEIGSSWNFGDDKAVNELAEAIEKLYASVGDDDAIRASMTQIENLIETYSRFENELHEVAKAENEALRSTHGRLTSDWQDVLGGDYETARRNRGKLGIGNTSKRGGSAGEIIGENSQLGIEESINESENLALALERLEKNAYNAAHEMVGFHEASVSLTGGIEAVQAEVDDLVNSLGLAADKLREVNSSMGDDFMNIDTSGVDDIFGDPAESIDRLRNSAQQAAPVVEQLGTAEQRVADSAQQVQTVGNIFEGISQGLTSLQGITLSDSLKNIESVSKALGTFGGKYAGSAAENLRNVAEALRGFNVQIPDYGESLTNFANGLSKLGGKKISDAFDILIRLKVAIESFNSLKIDPAVTASIEQLGTGLYRFGLAKMDKAVNNLPALAQGMSALIQSLANMPAVSENTIRLVTALGNMNVSGSQLSNTVNSLGTGLRRYRGHALNAHKASMSLASAFGKMYANFFIFFRLIRRFGKDITLASDLTEVQNVVDVTFADMADKMNDFSKSAIEALGMSELTAKQIGSKFQAMGSAMGISDSMVKSTNDFVQKATKGYADVANSMGDVSINLTRLAGDMASFYNQDYADVAEKLQAIFTGQTRPLRAYGLDLTQATLKEWALKNGMDANIKTMTQAEKTLLRYQYVMANTTAAHGDFIRTQDTWANSLRIASEKLNQLRIILGKIAIYSFKPLVQSFNSAMNQILKGAEGLLNALGKIFGWQVEWSDAGVLGEESDDAGELADNMGDAADNAKKFKNFLLGIDELNVLPDNSDNGKGGAGGLGDLTGDLAELGKFNLKPVEKGFESLYDTLYKLGKRINEVFKELLQSIDWDKVYKRARRFGRGFAEFVNGLYSDAETFYELGKFMAGGVNTIANALDAYHRELNGYQRGVDLGSFINGITENLDWQVIQSAAYEIAHDLAQTINGALFTTDWSAVGSTLAEGLNTAVKYFYTLGSEINWGLLGDSIANGINGFFSTFDIGRVADTINAWAEGMLDALYNALDKTDWNKVGKKMGEFLRKLNVTKIAAGLSKVLIKAFNAAADVLGSSLAQAPLETALLGAIAIIKPQNIGLAFSQLFKSAFNFVDKKTIVDGIKNLLGDLPVSLPKMLLGGGAGLAEFFVLKDTFKDLKLGAESFGGAIAKISTTALAAGGVMTAVFGFPAGTIAAGVIGITGALAGAVEGMAELQREADKIELGNILSNGGMGIGEYFDNASKDMRDTYDNYDKMARRVEETDLSGLKDNIARDMKEIGLSIDTLSTALGNNEITVEQKLDEIFKLFDNFKNNLSNLFAAEIGLLEEGAMNGLIDDVAELEAIANNMDLNMQKQIDDIKGKMEEATNLFQQNKVPYAEYEGMMQNYWKELNRIYSATANAGVSELEKNASVIDFSKLFLGEEDINGVQAELEKFGVTYQNAINDLNTGYEGIFETLTTLGEQASAMGDDAAAGQIANSIIKAQEKEIELIGEANSTYIAKIEELENQAWAQLGVILSNPEHLSQSDLQYQVQEYVNNVIDPLENAIKAETGRVGIEWGSSMSDLAHQLMEEMQGSLGGMAMDGEYYGIDLFRLWEERFSHAALTAEKSIKNLSAQQSTAEKVAVKFAESQGHFSKAIEKSNNTVADTEKSAKTSAAAYGNIDRAMADVRTTSGLAFSGIVDFNKVLGETGKSGEGIKTVSDSMTGLKNTLGQFGTALLPVKTGFMDFTMQTQAGMTIMTQVFGQSFNNIMKYGNQTISWMKGSFVPMFSGSYWQSLTASIPAAFGNAFRQAINIMTEMWKSFASWANENMKINANVTKNGNGATAKVNIPQYSTGGFPEDGFFYANHSEMVGKFANGQTAVANNEQIIEGIRQGVYEAVVSAMQGNNGNVTVELVGDASDIFTAVVKENNRSIMRTGASPIRT